MVVKVMEGGLQSELTDPGRRETGVDEGEGEGEGEWEWLDGRDQQI